MSRPTCTGVAVAPTVPGYTLQFLLGRGGSGEVWRAEPRGGGTAVAIKVLVAGDPERQAREAALLGELDHPHLVRLREVVHQPCRGGVPRVALVLDLLEGGSLAALLGRRGRLRPGEVVTAIAPVAAALAHAHERGIVHGDLSPGNIVFTAEGRPVLTDLGVARVLGETGEGLVTPAYVDPTVARGGAYGPSSDVFGIAAAAFHALTGVAPWNGARPADALGVAAAGEPPDLRELAPEAPEDLRAVITRGLAHDPHQRGSAAAFALDLRHACRPEPVHLSGVPGVAAQVPRTELTHQVPGRRARPVPVVVRPVSRLGRWRSAVRPSGLGRWRSAVRPAAHRAERLPAAPARMVGAVLVPAVLGAVLWAGATMTPAPDPATADVPVAAGAVTTEPTTAREASGTDPSRPREPPPAKDATPATPTTATTPAPPAPPAPPATPTTTTGWQALITGLYDARSEAYATGRTDRLADVYAAGSTVGGSDAARVSALRSAGERLRGFEPRVVRVLAVHEAGGGRREVRLVDRWPAFEVVAADRPDGPALRGEPGRADAVVRMVLLRTPDGWRIEEAERSG